MTNYLFNNVTKYMASPHKVSTFFCILCLKCRHLTWTTNVFIWKWHTRQRFKNQWCSLGHWMNYRKVNTYSKLPIQFIYYQSDISDVVSAVLSAALSVDCTSFGHAWNLNRAFAESKKMIIGWKKSVGVPSSAGLKQKLYEGTVMISWLEPIWAAVSASYCIYRQWSL